MTEPSVDRLAALLRVPTVSRRDAGDDPALAEFRARLAELYPLVHERLELESPDGRALLYRWPGATREAPTVLMAHYDVVPVDDQDWSRPPFSGEVVGEGEERRVWGRGALDDKGVLVSILEAVEAELAAGRTPAADVYLSFGPDEELAGTGAVSVVDALERRGIRPGLVVDEGGAVVEGVFPGVDRPMAVVGVSEKGIAGVELRVAQHGGHASTPGRDLATVRLARAILHLDRSPARAFLSAPTVEMVRVLGAHARPPFGWAFRAGSALRGPLAALFARLGGEVEAMVRTTRAVTRLSGSAADNVLAAEAVAMVNVRIAVGSSVAEAVEEIRRAVRDPAVEVALRYGSEPSPVSSISGPAWTRLADTVSEVFPEAIVTPYVMLQASDARHFTRVSDAVYRFLPFDLTAAERATIHGADESIRVSTYLRAIEFWRALLRRS